MKPLLIVLIAVVFLVALVETRVLANNYEFWVDCDYGTDGNNCTETSKCQSITYVIENKFSSYNPVYDTATIKVQGTCKDDHLQNGHEDLPITIDYSLSNLTIESATENAAKILPWNPLPAGLPPTYGCFRAFTIGESTGPGTTSCPTSRVHDVTIKNINFGDSENGWNWMSWDNNDSYIGHYCYCDSCFCECFIYFNEGGCYNNQNEPWNRYHIDTGGGIIRLHCADDITIRDCTFLGGHAGGWGDAIGIFRSTGTIGPNNELGDYQSTIAGSIHIDQCDDNLIIEDNIFEHLHGHTGVNKCQSYGGGRGGVISCWDSYSIIRNNTFDDCRTILGGAISVESTGTFPMNNHKLKIENNTFKNCCGYPDTNLVRKGGAIAIGPGSTVEISNNVFENNGFKPNESGAYNMYQGGAIYMYRPKTTIIEDNKFYGNFADSAGGAIFLDGVQDVSQGCYVGIINNLIVENKAGCWDCDPQITGNGAGIYITDSNTNHNLDIALNVFLSKCTIADNIIGYGGTGAGIYIGPHWTGHANIDMEDCIVWNTEIGNIRNIYVDDDFNGDDPCGTWFPDNNKLTSLTIYGDNYDTCVRPNKDVNPQFVEGDEGQTKNGYYLCQDDCMWCSGANPCVDSGSRQVSGDEGTTNPCDPYPSDTDTLDRGFHYR